MTRTKAKNHPTTTIQLWPGGQSVTYRGDPDGPPNQRSLRTKDPASSTFWPDGKWRKGTADEWRQIRIEVRARLYGERDMQGCDSALVDDLIKLANSGVLSFRDSSGEIAKAFSYDELRNLTRDCSEFDAAQCREYAEDYDLELPEIPRADCAACGGTARRVLDSGETNDCPTCKDESEPGQVPDPDADTDDTPGGWLTEARIVCQDYASENQAEVFEWWRVSSWLCKELHAIGEVTIDNGYGTWWGRTCTGQGWLMDGTLQQVAAKFERGES